MQKYLFAKFLDPINKDHQFDASEWPLHVTIVPRFILEIDESSFMDKLSDLLAQRKPITTTVTDEENFGPDYSIRVTVLEPKSELSLLHKDIIKLLKNHGASFDEPEFNEDGYRAHVTNQNHGRLQKGDEVTIDEVTLVDMFPDGDKSQRRVLKTIKLS